MAKKSFLGSIINKTIKGVSRFFGRYWFRLALSVLVIGGMVSVQRSIYADSLFWVRYFDIQTTGSLDHEKILRWSGLRYDMNIFDINLRSVEKRLIRHPEVSASLVRRVMPNRIGIFVSERKAFAELTAKADSRVFYTVDEEGFVIPTGWSEVSAHIPLIVIPELAQHPLDIGHRFDRIKFLEIKRLVHEIGTSGLLRFSEITRIEQSHDGTFEILLATGPKIFVQNEFRKELSKLVHFKEVLRAAETDIEYIDLRFSDVAIKRRPQKNKFIKPE